MKTYRVYFNTRHEQPLIWSYDEGPGTEEHKVKQVILNRVITAITRFDPTKHPPADASAWFEVVGFADEDEGIVTFRDFDLYE